MDFEPFLIGWDITNLCNLKCLHCNRVAGKSLKKELSLKEIKDILDQIKDNFNSIEHISLGGGEPFLRKDLFKILDYALLNKKLNVRINTNGTLITKKIARKLKSLGIYHVQVSIEGSKKTHDFIRGLGSYNQIIKGIKELVKIGVSTSIRMTLNGYNHKEVKDVFDLASSLKVKRFSIGRIICSGRADKNKEGLSIKKEDYFTSLKKAFRLSRERKIEFYCTDPLSLFVDKKNFEKVLKRLNLEECIGGCIAGIAQFFISSIGKIYGCGLLEIEAGNLREKKIREIWDNSELFKELRKRKEDLIKEDSCYSCKFMGICGGCRSAAYYENKNIFSQDPFCIFKEENECKS